MSQIKGLFGRLPKSLEPELDDIFGNSEEILSDARELRNFLSCLEQLGPNSLSDSNREMAGKIFNDPNCDLL